ncbi:class I adenylate-forming enzyme family protein [Streptacidiphilus sp. N1-10]|uniref:Class I adenylate-forming enzyme family protein n=1 Tax=Streptacidiphilus jeojiensis TaxID=3229225 RepID=A0ABV6XKP4_9ACTN
MDTSPSTLRWQLPPLPDRTLKALTGPDAPFAHHEEDVNGRRGQVFTHRFRSLPDLLRTRATSHADHPYLIDGEQVVTYAQAWRAVGARAAALARRGVRTGDRVALLGANQSEYLLHLWAVLRLGAVAVGLNGWWTGSELMQGVELSQPRLLLGDARRIERLPPAARAAAPVELFDEFGARADREADRTPARPGPDDGETVAEDAAALLLFTSGTTGRAKGALISHRNIVHAAQANAMSGTLGAVDGAGRNPADGAGSTMTALVSSPLFHVSGLMMALASAPFAGGALVMPRPGRWDPETHLDLMAEHKVTVWNGVPAQFWRLLDTPGFDAARLPAVAVLGTGGANLPPRLTFLLGQRFPHVRLGNGFGMTETFGSGTTITGEELRAHPSSVGAPVPLAELQVRDESGTPVPDGTVGEIWLRSGSVFLGYWQDPRATARVLDAEGWYRTGDFGRVEGGRLYLESRRQDLIVRAGENIYPVEVENRLVEHPSVADVAVVGVPHEVLGQEVKACIVLRPGTGWESEGVRAWVGEALAAFKVPAHVEFRDSLPYSATGKVVKRLLEDQGDAGNRG